MLITEHGYDILGKTLALKITKIRLLTDRDQKLEAYLICPVSYADHQLNIVLQLNEEQLKGVAGDHLHTAILYDDNYEAIIRLSVDKDLIKAGNMLIKLNVKIG